MTESELFKDLFSPRKEALSLSVIGVENMGEQSPGLCGFTSYNSPLPTRRYFFPPLNLLSIIAGLDNRSDPITQSSKPM